MFPCDSLISAGPLKGSRDSARVPKGSLTPSNLGLTDRDGTFYIPVVFEATYKGLIRLTQPEKLWILGVILFFHKHLVHIFFFGCVSTIPGCHKKEQQDDSVFEGACH